MNEEQSRLLQEQGLSFFGTVTASLSHEINNVTAIIGELSGLLDDLLLGAERGRPLDHEKLRNLSEKITGQVNKGKSIIKRLNRFAHSTDEPIKDFDLAELLEQIISIAQRFAFLRGVRLETERPQETITIRSNPFAVQQAIFTAVDLALTSSEKNGRVNVSSDKEDNGAKIVVTCAPVDEGEDARSTMSFLSLLMKQLRGTVESVPAENDRQSLILHVPASIDDGASSR